MGACIDHVHTHSASEDSSSVATTVIVGPRTDYTQKPGLRIKHADSGTRQMTPPSRRAGVGSWGRTPKLYRSF